MSILPPLSLPQRDKLLESVVQPERNTFSPPPNDIDLVFKSVYSAFTGSYAMYIWACAFGCQDELVGRREIHDFDVIVPDESAMQKMSMKLLQPLDKISVDRAKPRIDIIIEKKRSENQGFGRLDNSEMIQLNYGRNPYNCRVLKPEELIECLKKRDPEGTRQNTKLDIQFLEHIIKLKASFGLNKF